MKPWPRTTITFVSSGEAPGHVTRDVLVNGTLVTVALGGVEVSQPASDDVQRVTLTLLPDEVHFIGPDGDAPASTETARNSDLSDDDAEQAPTDTSTRERAREDVDPDEALARVIRAGVGKPSASDAEMWATAARAAREHLNPDGIDWESTLSGVVQDRDAAIDRAEKAEDKVQRLEASVAAWKSEVVKSARRQAVAMAERDEFNGFWKDALADVRKARDERDEWKAKHAALREDVEALRRNPKSLTDVLMRAADILDSDDARDPQADPDTVTLLDPTEDQP